MRVTIAEGARVFPLWFGYLLVQHVCREDSVYISHSTCCWQTCMCEWRGVAVWMSTSVEGIWMWFIYPEKMRVVSMNEKGGGVSCAQTLCLLESDWVTLQWWLEHDGKRGGGISLCKNFTYFNKATGFFSLLIVLCEYKNRSNFIRFISVLCSISVV